MAKGPTAGAPEKGFATPPEVTGYFTDKGLKPRFSWRDVWGEEHAHAFTVAKAVDAELLGAFQSSIREAIDGGWTFERWRDRAREDLTKMGWWEEREVFDPAGGRKAKVDFSDPRRLQTIYWSNLRAARAAGQWERAQRTKRALPYLLYVQSVSVEPRPAHLSWVGTILPVDDPFWSTHFPPNGWNCKCSVRQVSRRERDRLVGTTRTFETVDAKGNRQEMEVEYRNAAPDDGTTTFLNNRTGRTTEIPIGIDPGWHTNPGRTRAQTLTARLDREVARADAATARRTLADWWDTPGPRAAIDAPVRVDLPVAVLEDVAGEMNRTRAGVEGRPVRFSPVATIANETVRDLRSSAPGFGLEALAELQDMLDLAPMPPAATGGAEVARTRVLWGERFYEILVELVGERLVVEAIKALE